VICDLLPETGLGAAVGLLLLLAIACLVAGTTLVLLARRSRGGPAILVLLLLLCAVTTMSTLGTATPAQAATPGCSSSSSSTSLSSSVDRLILTQTSTTVGLAPGVAPAPITGRLVNHSAENTHITAVDVEIASITPRSNPAANACRVDDYQVIAPRMRVRRTLGPGGSTPFAGASIEFNNKLTNQDGCKGATINLHYTANPS
jgi:hypothetical protein